MTSLLQIRNVPEETHRALKARAAARGRSLDGYLLEIVSREVARPSVEEVLRRSALRHERARASALDSVAATRSRRQGREARENQHF
jgi:plasmid stability protein